MGSSLYSSSDRLSSHRVAAYAATSLDNLDVTFKQNALRAIHESMDPKGAKIREARDSATHPETVPIILALDVTGSMLDIPLDLIKNGLPHMMDSLIQRGVKDAALLFLAIGDHLCGDRAPLQVGQFESGDVELDTWLERSWLEGGGGANEGESYLLAYYYAAFHTVTDAWEKRKQKGFLFTIGDEPPLMNLAKNSIEGLMGDTGLEKGFTFPELLAEAQKKWNVYHLNMLQGNRGPSSLAGWKKTLGQDCIEVPDRNDVAKIIADTVVHALRGHLTASTKDGETPATKKPKIL